MALHRMKNCEVEAHLIDWKWQVFLTKEKGFEAAPIGHYYFVGVDGSGEIWPPDRFERLFAPVING